jgi:hypothetical protein
MVPSTHTRCSKQAVLLSDPYGQGRSADAFKATSSSAHWGQVVAEEGRRKVLSHRWRRACDREHGCEVSTKVVGRSTVYVYGCYAKARPTSLLCRGDICW